MIRKKIINQVHFIAFGRVQGVCFRYFVKSMAQSENIYGWVKNLPDNTVEGVMQGSCLKLENMINSIKRGSNLSRVDKVICNWQEVKIEYKSFDIW